MEGGAKKRTYWPVGTITQSERINAGVPEQNTNITFLYVLYFSYFFNKSLMSNGCLV